MGAFGSKASQAPGATFHFTISLGVQAGEAASQSLISPSLLRDCPALNVDDNSTNRRVLQAMLARRGMKPTAVAGSHAALQALGQARNEGHQFPLILLDSQMPEMDGFTLAQEIRKDPRSINATIMMLTSARHLGDAARCRELGISAYMVKPIRQAELLDGICVLLQESPGKKPESLVIDHIPRENPNKRRVLLAEDNLVNQKLAFRLLGKRGFNVTVVGDGQAALSELENESFDIVLMDVMMPNMDGFEATAAIRKKEEATGGHIPIIANDCSCTERR